LKNQTNPNGPTARRLRRTARVAFDPRQAFLEADDDGLLRICHAPRFVDPRLPELWELKATTLIGCA
jgi:hypothetical protein